MHSTFSKAVSGHMEEIKAFLVGWGEAPREKGILGHFISKAGLAGITWSKTFVWELVVLHGAFECGRLFGRPPNSFRGTPLAFGFYRDYSSFCPTLATFSAWLYPGVNKIRGTQMRALEGLLPTNFLISLILPRIVHRPGGLPGPPKPQTFGPGLGLGFRSDGPGQGITIRMFGKRARLGLGD